MFCVFSLLFGQSVILDFFVDPVEMKFPVIATPLHFLKDKSQAPKVQKSKRSRDGVVIERSSATGTASSRSCERYIRNSIELNVFLFFEMEKAFGWIIRTTTTRKGSFCACKTKYREGRDIYLLGV